MEKHIMHGFLAFWMERLISVWEFYKKTGTLPDGSKPHWNDDPGIKIDDQGNLTVNDGVLMIDNVGTLKYRNEQGEYVKFELDGSGYLGFK